MGTVWEKQKISAPTGDANIFAGKPMYWLQVLKVLRGKEGLAMLLRTIVLLVLGIVSFAFFMALSEIDVVTGMPPAISDNAGTLLQK